MNLSQLHYFQIVAEEEHISRAAEKLHISQPSLSTTIRRLESELDTPLFDRRGRNIYLNKAGQQLLEHVQFIFSQIEQLQKDLYEEDFYIAHGLRMAVNNASYLEGWLSEFVMQHADARITQVTVSKEQMITGLLDERIDLAIGDLDDAPPEIETITLMEDEYMVAIPASHPLAQKESLVFDDIRDEAFSSLPSNTVDCFINLIFAQKGLNPNVIFEGQLSMMFKLLRTGHALMFTSRNFWDMYMRHAKEVNPREFELMSRIKVLPLTDVETQFTMSVGRKKGRALPSMAKTLLDFIVDTENQTNILDQTSTTHDKHEGGAL